jgi:NAD+ diphosphatase
MGWIMARPPLSPILATRPNPYTGNPLDRVDARRSDTAWIDASRADPNALFIPLWRSRSLLRGLAEGQPEGILLSPAAWADPSAPWTYPWAFLGLLADQPVFAIDLSASEEPLALLPTDSGTFEDLRRVAGGLPPHQGAILAHARGLLHWRSRHRFCGNCGSACEVANGGHVMICPSCKTHHFPRTDPAVIMLVVAGDEALLGHSTRFPRATMYSTLAGFVEPGESLEEAVAREVFEETGVRVGQVYYHSSQPWPFPASIMLGFYAEALSREITIDPGELMDARWFTRAEMLDPQAHGFSLPRGDSIARRLIEDWLAAP